MRTRMKKALPRLNRRLPKEIHRVEATWWEPWWEFVVGIPYEDQMVKAITEKGMAGTDGVSALDRGNLRV